MKGSGPPGVCGGDGLRKSQPATVCHRLSSTRPASSMPSSRQPHSQMGPRLSCRWQALRCPGKDAAGPGWWGSFRGSVVPPGSSVPVASVDRTRSWCRQGQRWVLPAAPGLSPPPRVCQQVGGEGSRQGGPCMQAGVTLLGECERNSHTATTLFARRGPHTGLSCPSLF